MNSRANHISVVIPVYEAESYLGRLYDELTRCIDEWPYKNVDVILVEDGSRDESWKEICDIVEKDGRFSATRLSRNFGQHNALLCGIRQAKGDVVVTLDGAEVETVNGATIEVTVTEDGAVLINEEATVVQTDIQGSNGVIHVIDTVLLPPAE